MQNSPSESWAEDYWIVRRKIDRVSSSKTLEQTLTQQL